MGYLSKGILPRLRTTVPRQLQQAVAPIYLYMPPLPIGTVNPLRSVPKEDKVANSTISGVSLGSGITTVTKVGTKRHRQSNKAAVVGLRSATGQRKTNVNSKSKGKTKNQKRVNGRFVK